MLRTTVDRGILQGFLVMSLSENGESAELNPRQTELAVCEASCWKRKEMLMKK
jgi:hypothetical protein